MNQFDIQKSISDPIIKITREFIDNENGIKIIDFNSTKVTDTITLPEDTIYFKIKSDNLDLVFGIWYESNLQDILMMTLNYGEILPHEEEELKLDTAKEVGNIIFGNAICYFLEDHSNTILSPSIVLDNEVKLYIDDDKELVSTSLSTDYGAMRIYVISPQSAIFS